MGFPPWFEKGKNKEYQSGRGGRSQRGVRGDRYGRSSGRFAENVSGLKDKGESSSNSADRKSVV